MKYTVILLLFFQIMYSQKYEKDKKGFDFKPSFRLNAIIPFNTGNNYLGKANKYNFGIGTSVSLARYNNIILGVGYDYVNYSITDISKAGNLNSSKLTSLYGSISYKQEITEKIALQPYLAIGWSFLKFDKDRFGRQNGTDYRMGFYTDYKLTKVVSVFTGIAFVKSKFNINTAPEFIPFYNHANTWQINIGLKISKPQKTNPTN